MKYFFILVCAVICICPHLSQAQTNDSPAGAYQWKKGKTELQSGYVVLKSGKRMDGKISLIGSASQVTEVAYEGEGKEIKFPIASLKAYGLDAVNPNASTSTSGTPINESPESMYEWRSMGIVMGKEITSTTPRAGYVVLRNGTKHEGELKLRRKAGVREAEVVQVNLAKVSKTSYPGTVFTASEKKSGEIAIMPLEGKRYREKIIFKGTDGQFTEYTPQTISGFMYTNKGKETTFTVIDNKFMVEKFNGKTFQVYLNPAPTSINKFATSLVKGAVSVGSSAAASAAVNKDAKKNNYETNLDSVMRVSSTEELIELRDAMASVAGYENAQDAINNSDNQSLKTNLSAIELTIQSRQATDSPGGIVNEEWVIFNRITNEKTIVYKSEYKEQIDVLLMGCEKYFELTKSQQNDLQKWDNLSQTMKLLDGCY
jgi:hypothetical protein